MEKDVHAWDVCGSQPNNLNKENIWDGIIKPSEETKKYIIEQEKRNKNEK